MPTLYSWSPRWTLIDSYALIPFHPLYPYITITPIMQLIHHSSQVTAYSLKHTYPAIRYPSDRGNDINDEQTGTFPRPVSTPSSWHDSAIISPAKMAVQRTFATGKAAWICVMSSNSVLFSLLHPWPPSHAVFIYVAVSIPHLFRMQHLMLQIFLALIIRPVKPYA